MPDGNDERGYIERDRDLAWELYGVQPTHQQIPVLAQSVLASEPSFTGMIILLALHYEHCGEIEKARKLLQELIGRRDRQYLNAVRKLRDLEFGDKQYEASLRLAEVVLREDPEADWIDHMEHASAMIFCGNLVAGWNEIDEAVAHCARNSPDSYGDALGQRATRLLASGAPPERILDAAEEAVAADPTELLLAVTLGFAYLYDYRAEEAEQLFLRVLREDPTETIAQGGLSVARAFLAPIIRGDVTMDDHRAAGSGEMAWRYLHEMLFEIGMAEALAALDEVMEASLGAVLGSPADPEKFEFAGDERKLFSWHNGQEAGTGALWKMERPFRLLTAEHSTALDKAIEEDRETWSNWEPESESFELIATDDAGGYYFVGKGGRVFLRLPRGDAGLDAGTGADAGADADAGTGTGAGAGAGTGTGTGAGAGAGTGADIEIADSLAGWVWGRVAAFGGVDARPGMS